MFTHRFYSFPTSWCEKLNALGRLKYYKQKHTDDNNNDRYKIELVMKVESGGKLYDATGSSSILAEVGQPAEKCTLAISHADLWVT